MSNQQFIKDVSKYVIKYAPKYNIKVASPIIAQAILESGWGKSKLARTYHNYFGMKCGSSWKGKSVNLITGEQKPSGERYTIKDNFRVFDSLEDGIKGYFEFLFNHHTRYNNLKNVTDPKTYLVNIKKDGYATDVNYVSSLMKVIKSYNLTSYDKLLNKSSSTKKSKVSYYKKYTGNSLHVDEVFRSIGVPSKYIKSKSTDKPTVRKPVADKNNIKNYTGTTDQNKKLIDLARKGKLIKV